MEQNEAGSEFMRQARIIMGEAGKAETPQRAARIAVFAMLVMLDDSDEHFGEDYRVFIQERDDSLTAVNFFHHDL